MIKQNADEYCILVVYLHPSVQPPPPDQTRHKASHGAGRTLNASWEEERYNAYRQLMSEESEVFRSVASTLPSALAKEASLVRIAHAR